jgi:hypothetical protein
MTPVLIPCSRSAHDQNVLARRPQWEQHGCHSKGGDTSKFGGINNVAVRCVMASIDHANLEKVEHLRFLTNRSFRGRNIEVLYFSMVK